MSKQGLSAISDFFAEIGVLKRLPKMGMRITGVLGEKEGYVAQHVLRAAQIGYVLAYLEKANPEKTSLMLLFHDNGEVRIGDHNKISARYLDTDRAEKQAFEDQISKLPKELSLRIGSLFNEFEERGTREAIVAKDADWLETAITAKELLEQGGAIILEDWIKNVKKALKTKSAKEILDFIEDQTDFTNNWWKSLKKISFDK